MVMLLRVSQPLRILGREALKQKKLEQMGRQWTHYRSGAIKPKPNERQFGIFGVVCAVVPGLFVGAVISKNIANFLEENELFVPEEDDDEEY